MLVNVKKIYTRICIRKLILNFTDIKDVQHEFCK